ncbi:MAG TPA: hypothetical protein VIU41_13590 [Geobacteraceae bacterium]
MAKSLQLILYRQNHLRSDWLVDLTGSRFADFCTELTAELARYDIQFSATVNDDLTIDIASYADLLNAVRISSPQDGFTSKCVGHIIGKSQNLDLLEDIRRAVTRIAFAPETIPPDDHNRRVCHNCGCGC